MVERERIVELASRRVQDPGVLVTLVQAEGSSYRKRGARLLTFSGESAGTISGGCMEAEVMRKAAWTVHAGAVVERYSTIFDDTSELPFGLGCGGVVDLLFEPADTAEFRALLEALAGSLRGEGAVVITFLPVQNAPLLRAVLSAGGDALFRSEGLAPSRIDDALAGVLEDAFVERLAPPQRLIVFGAGDDARPLVRMASLIGWSVSVVDGRRQLARRERFPEAGRVVLMQPEQISDLRILREDAVVLMTHSYEQDRAWLAAVLPIAPRYLGLLGARHRSSFLVGEVSAQTGLSTQECCERIYAPVGLDLGGEGPEAIALAIIAEAQACCMGRLAGSRRLTSSDISMQAVQEEVSRYRQAPCALEASAD